MTVHWLLKPPTTLLNITDKLQVTSGPKKTLSRESCSTILLIFMFILKMEKSHISVKCFSLEGWVWHDISKPMSSLICKEKENFKQVSCYYNKHEMQHCYWIFRHRGGGWRNKARSSFFKLTPIFLLLDETIHKAFDIAPGGCIPNNQDDQMETTIQTPKNPWTKNCLPKPPIMKVQA